MIPPSRLHSIESKNKDSTREANRQLVPELAGRLTLRHARNMFRHHRSVTQQTFPALYFISLPPLEINCPALTSTDAKQETGYCSHFCPKTDFLFFLYVKKHFAWRIPGGQRVSLWVRISILGADHTTLNQARNQRVISRQRAQAAFSK